tara:strand:+ start:1315 stop:1605 length:291 start_codon:yes stop_codon:yes gene_type:complete
MLSASITSTLFIFILKLVRIKHDSVKQEKPYTIYNNIVKASCQVLFGALSQPDGDAPMARYPNTATGMVTRGPTPDKGTIAVGINPVSVAMRDLMI